jgi:protoheme IX farnesyltransferase
MSVTLARAEPSIAGVGDYIELMKPRVMSLVVFTALVGLILAVASRPCWPAWR